MDLYITIFEGLFLCSKVGMVNDEAKAPLASRQFCMKAKIFFPVHLL
jgi:hypothetical protein